MKGTVKWFNPTKGFGFIKPDEGDKDVFVHHSALRKAGMATLDEGQRIQFEIKPGQKGDSADNLMPLAS